MLISHLSPGSVSVYPVSDFPSVDAALEYLTSVILQVAELAIPQEVPSSKPRLPFWEFECSLVTQDMKRTNHRWHKQTQTLNF